MGGHSIVTQDYVLSCNIKNYRASIDTYTCIAAHWVWAQRTPHFITYLVAFIRYVHFVENGYRSSISARGVAQYNSVPNQTKHSVYFLHLKVQIKNAELLYTRTLYLATYRYIPFPSYKLLKSTKQTITQQRVRSEVLLLRTIPPSILLTVHMYSLTRGPTVMVIGG